jgi:hypothetical protein
MRATFFVVLIVVGIASYAVISISTTPEQQANPAVEPNIGQSKTLVSDHVGMNSVPRPTRISLSSTI